MCKGERATCEARCLMRADCEALTKPEVDLATALCRFGCDAFECADGELLPNGWQCDHFVDCADGSDERNCEL
jgi:hypothetical protein